MKADLVYCHGLMGHQGECPALLTQLSEQYRVHTFNFSGHGGAPASGAWRVSSFADDLAQFIRESDLENPVILGYSLGGYVALYSLIYRGISCRQLFTLNTKWIWDEATASAEAGKLDADKIAEKAPALIDHWTKIHAPADWRDMLACTRSFMATLPAEQGLTNAVLAQVQTPIAICLGDTDRFVTREESLYLQGKLPNATFHLIENTPHQIERLNVSGIWDVIAGR